MARKKKKSIIRVVIRWVMTIALFLTALSILSVLVYRFVNPPVTPLMIIRSMNGGEPRAEREWVPIENIPQSVIDAVVASEDNLFMEHSGFDFDAMRKAHQNNKKGKRIHGASTITQQMCKNVFLWNGRSYTRKAIEAWFTVWVELLWNKARIMEVYLNVIEMGNGIYGIDAAARTYYRKPAHRLSREEAAMIAIILPSPRKRNPTKPTEYMQRRQQQILSLMDKIGTVKL